MFFGSILGAILAGFTTEAIGRKKSILLGTASIMIGNMLVAFAHDSEILMVGRTLGGLGFGAHVHIVAKILPIGNNVTRKKDNHQACSLKISSLERELVFFK